MEKNELWPFAGLRVVDLSTEIAGAYATKILVDSGAEVIKVEPPTGDPLRSWTASGQQLGPDEDGALFDFLNASKRSVVIDLETEVGKSDFLELVSTVDLVFESFAPGTLDALGLTLAAMQANTPALSVVSITPFGQTGPWCDRPNTEFTLQAAVGSIAYRGLVHKAEAVGDTSG